MNARFSLFLCLFVCIPVLSLAQKADSPESRQRSFRERLALVAVDSESPFGAGKIEYLEEEVKRKLTAEERDVFEATDAGEWKVFEDDVIRFEHPMHPLFSVTVLDEKQREQIRVVGGVASMADNSFERAYHLKVGDLYYGVILVREADWFDEGICLCGPIVFKKCLLADGTALEFSLLPSGDVKKVQALGASHRAILFEWTHSVIPQSAYARLGRSLRFKQPSPRSLDEWHAFSKQKRGVVGLVTWMERGDSATKVRSLLGEPTRTEGEILEYVSEEWRSDGDGYRTTLRVNLKGGVFDRFEQSWNKWEEMPPKPETIAWARARLEHWTSDKASKADKKTVMPRELAQMVELFFKNGTKAKDPEWGEWSGIARGAVELGLKERRVLDVVLERYKEDDLGHFYSNEILEAFEFPGRQGLFEKRARVLLGREKPGEGGELNNLFAMMDRKNPSYQEIVKAGCAHADPDTRYTAYNFADRLPKPTALELLRKGLEDTDDSARRMAALNIDEVVTKSDLGWLRAQLAKEGDSDVKRGLEQAIEAANEKR